ncbi:MAG: IS1595 family transposase [Aestuariivita sp.]|nr:IS1595 family transposase [Aestuariivita sp.]MCY4348144.1 IS1595 family transposase [Aestuariivita sp.]
MVLDTTSATLQGFVEEHSERDALVYTDEAAACVGIDRRHERLNHCAREYVRDLAHTQGIESFWSMLKRAHKGTFHKMSVKHLQRYIYEFSGRHNVREWNTVDRMADVVANLVGKRLSYAELTADNGLPNRLRKIRRVDAI